MTWARKSETVDHIGVAAIELPSRVRCCCGWRRTDTGDATGRGSAGDEQEIKEPVRACTDEPRLRARPKTALTDTGARP